jgi:Magnesium chelatase, subunit ChlI C-terminal
MRLSARGYHRVLRVARTLGDLDGAENDRFTRLTSGNYEVGRISLNDFSRCTFAIRLYTSGEPEAEQSAPWAGFKMVQHNSFQPNTAFRYDQTAFPEIMKCQSNSA